MGTVIVFGVVMVACRVCEVSWPAAILVASVAGMFLL
jgi:hypothetical protein